MPECQNCGHDYEGTPEVCPECGVLITEMIVCRNCKENIQSEAEYCPVCGILQIDNQDIECENHKNTPAVAVCIICGKPVCQKCRKIKSSKTFCEDDKHVRVYQSWAIAYISSTEYEAEMVKANLENAGIEAMIFNQQDHAYFLTVGSMARVNVMVPNERVNDAKKVIHSLNFEADDNE
jgi:RNA polymerase subunit RPABC4/transcription elongation factor Spt4